MSVTTTRTTCSYHKNTNIVVHPIDTITVSWANWILYAVHLWYVRPTRLNSTSSPWSLYRICIFVILCNSSVCHISVNIFVLGFLGTFNGLTTIMLIRKIPLTKKVQAFISKEKSSKGLSTNDAGCDVAGLALDSAAGTDNASQWFWLSELIKAYNVNLDGAHCTFSYFIHIIICSNVCNGHMIPTYQLLQVASDIYDSPCRKLSTKYYKSVQLSNSWRKWWFSSLITLSHFATLDQVEICFIYLVRVNLIWFTWDSFSFLSLEYS